MTLTEMFSQPAVNMADVIRTFDPDHVPADPELSARLTARTVKQVLGAYRRAAVKQALSRFWWAPLRYARALWRLFTD